METFLTVLKMEISSEIEYTHPFENIIFCTLRVAQILF